MKNTVWLLVLACLLAAGCRRDDGDDGDDAAAGGLQAAPPPATEFGITGAPQGSERTWVGLLPCSDCQGIDTRLVLRSGAGRRDYLITETYIGGRGKNSFERSGRWAELVQVIDGEPVTLFVLDPEQAGQRFSLQADGALELLDGRGNRPEQAVAYRLQRL